MSGDSGGGPRGETDLDIVIVSHGDGSWLQSCLRSLERHRGDCRIGVVILENGPSDPPAELDSAAPSAGVRVLRVPNRGFAAANNVGIRVTSARHVLFLNPDTEMRSGTLAEAVEILDRRPAI